jgi:pimeloyl-ACP methyl ester carboxylesterase
MPHLERSGLSFHVQLVGAGPPLALVHGLLVGSLASWYFGIAPRLGRAFRVLMFDLRGHGLSARAASGYDLPTLASDLGALLPEAGTGPAVVVGHSWGALTALRFALDQPERVAKLVLVDAPLPPSQLPELAGFLAARPEEQVAALPGPLREAVLGQSRQGRRLLEQVKYLAQEASVLADIARTPDFDDAALTKLRCQVDLVYGERSGCRAAGERLAKVIPGASLTLVPSGHFVPAEAPGALADVLEERLCPK